MLYLVEDNGYAISVPVEVQTPAATSRACVEGFPGLRVFRCDGTDYLASYRTMREAVTHVRDAQGPGARARHGDAAVLALASPTTRSCTRRRASARPKRAAIRWCACGSSCKTKGWPPTRTWRRSWPSVEREVNQAAEEALRAPQPDPETAALYVFSPDVDPIVEPVLDRAAAAGQARHDGRGHQRHAEGRDGAQPAHRRLRPGRGRCQPRARRCRWSPARAACSRSTHGLQRPFGSDRVFNSPLAEANIVGRAVGMALRGLKPVVEIQFFDYIWPAFMQIRDELSMMRYRSGNHWSCPVVIRVPIGGYLRGGAPYHSQSGVSIFAHTPGIRIVLPSNAQDAAGLLRTAIRCDDPVLFCEHKHLYRQTYNKAPYPGPDYMMPFGKAAVVRDGTDVVVFTWGALVQRSLLAAQQAERQASASPSIDLRTIIPYDWETIAGLHEEDQPGHRRARGSAHVRLRRRDRRPHLRGAVRIPRRAGEARRGARLPGRLRAGPRGRDPAGLGDVLKAIKALAAY